MGFISVPSICYVFEKKRKNAADSCSTLSDWENINKKFTKQQVLLRMAG